MISKGAIKKICSKYAIGKVVSVEKELGGILNDNYVLLTETGKYFIKSIREKAKRGLETIYSVESLMKRSGIPAVAMLKTKSGAIFVSDGEEIHTLYPFVEGDKSDDYSIDDYKIMGEMLGRIHLVGQGDISSVTGLRPFKRPIDQDIINRMKYYHAYICNKGATDEIDKLFLRYIDFKISTYSKIKVVNLDNDTLIHGDYHARNLLIDKNSREIVGVCDWEKTDFGSRAYELARSLLNCCFSNDYELDKALSYSKQFLAGYLSVFPMPNEDMISGLEMRLHRMCLSSWIEEKYYNNGDSRGNIFIEHQMNLMDSMVNGKLLGQIKNLLV